MRVVQGGRAGGGRGRGVELVPVDMLVTAVDGLRLPWLMERTTSVSAKAAPRARGERRGKAQVGGVLTEGVGGG